MRSHGRSEKAFSDRNRNICDCVNDTVNIVNERERRRKLVIVICTLTATVYNYVKMLFIRSTPLVIKNTSYGRRILLGVRGAEYMLLNNN